MLDLSEFRAIPGYPKNYLISEDGRVVNTKRRNPRLLKPSIVQRGYRIFSLSEGKGTKRIVYRVARHRLMMLAWRYPEDKDPQEHHVNHLNGVPGDDWLDNLEWCTLSENILHAYATGLMIARHPIQVRDALTGEVKQFNTARLCGNEYGLSKDGVFSRCNCSMSRIWPGFLQFRYQSDEPWYIPTQEELDKAEADYGRQRAVVVWYPATNQSIVFAGMTEAARHLGIALSTLSVRADRPGYPTFPEGYQVSYLNDPTPFRKVDDVFLDIEQSNPGTVLLAALNTKTNELHITTLPKASELSGAKKTTINMRLNSTSKNRSFGDWVIDYYREFIRVHSVSDYRLNVL